MRGMKRTLDQIEAFERAKEAIPDLRFKIAGDNKGTYGAQVMARIADSPYASDIEYMGRVSLEDKITLMQRCHLILVTSVKEGWGLIVTEAASQGTPAVVYDVDGLRDSVRHGQTGIVAKPVPAQLAAGIVELLDDPSYYAVVRHNAWEWSKDITFDKGYQQLTTILETA
jgi:glycosyltransferase involved in cell wall biosynthesis